MKDNKSREYAGLLEALKAYKLKEGLILTENQEFKETIQGEKIEVKPIWKWLLEA